MAVILAPVFILFLITHVLLIGGGILGCSIAYWLTKMGEADGVDRPRHAAEGEKQRLEGQPLGDRKSVV